MYLTDRLYNCGAGVTGFHVEPGGILRPCLMMKKVGFDLAGGGFAEGWRSLVSMMDEKKMDEAFRCHSCDKWQLCGFCPAFFEMETGSESTCSEFICAMGERRSEQIRDHKTQEVGSSPLGS